MDLKQDIFDKAKNFLLEPKTAFDNESKSDTMSALKYAVIWLFISSLLGSIVFAIIGDKSTEVLSTLAPLAALDTTMEITAGSVVSTFLGGWIGGIIGLFMIGLWLHLFAYIFGARMGLENTFRIIFYGNTPGYILSWIPFVNVIGFLWSMVLYAIGLNRLQKMTKSMAVITVIAAVIIPTVIILGLIAMTMSTMSSLAAMGSMY